MRTEHEREKRRLLHIRERLSKGLRRIEGELRARGWCPNPTDPEKTPKWPTPEAE
jgi:hypothetical protein